MTPSAATDSEPGWANVRTWSTAGVPEREQFPAWADVIADAFVPASVSRAGDGAFISTVTATSVGPLSVSYLVSQPQHVVRTAEDIQRAAGDVFFLNLPLTDGATVTQEGRSARLHQGDFVIFDGARPFELQFDRPFHQISLALPHELLAPLLAAPAEATGVCIPGAHGVGAVAAAAIRALAQSGGALDRRAARALSDHVAGLIALAAGEVRTQPRSATRALLLQAALDEVERSLDNPQLSAAHVAQRIGVSTRYLQLIFADRGTTFTRWLLRRRLERAHRALTDPAHAHWSITAIAVDLGFRDPSYFTRAFKAEYGVTPRDLRRGRR